jgi:cation transport protein ChaC
LPGGGILMTQKVIDSHHRFDGPFPPLVDAVRNASRDRFLEGMPPGDPWIFAYGSLMWDRSVFPYQDTASALLHGYHRRFCIWTVLARGTPDLPGLALGLEPGGSCRGVAFRVDRHKAKEAFDEVWRREMHTACYKPRWTTARLKDRAVEAVVFVARQDHIQYAGNLEHETVAFHIARAHGSRGACRDYLAETLNNLEMLGVRDRRLEGLFQLVDAKSN